MNTFESLGLSAPIVNTLSRLGYESPTPIQAEAIPVFLKGGDLIAQAQTGTGKTAAFALPIVDQIDVSNAKPQALILAPTRELAIQVAEALKSYAKHIPSFHVLPIYGGQEYFGQLTALKRGVHVVVGTPGRVMDHMRRGTLKLESLKTFVLDEADEMLKMGFIDDIEWILQELPEERQIGLFSATMPPAIQKVANSYLRNASKIQIASQTKTVALVDQCGVFVTQYNKMEALTRFLETEIFDATIIFARTKTATTELSEKLSARGYSVDALNGDVRQNLREKIIQRLKNKSLDIVVATEVAARGLDVERLDLVINYDIPTDAETYVHRVGRTGRAGRSGKAITFITPRERGLLATIERTINTKINPIPIPSLKQMHEKRLGNFSKKIMETISLQNLDIHRELIDRITQENEFTVLDIAAALAFMSQGEDLSKPEGNDELSRPVRVDDRDRDYNDRPPRNRNRGSRDDGRRGDRGDSRRGDGRRDDSRREPRRDDRRDDRRPFDRDRAAVAKPAEHDKKAILSKPKKVRDDKEGLGARKKRVFSKKSSD